MEAGIHAAPDADHVHLHELGGLDTLVDVVGAVSGVDLLGVDQVVCSPIPLGRGFTRSAHGRIPVPAPATVALLQGAPVAGSEVEGETVTPTGAALSTSLASAYGPIPAMTLRSVGYGAGRKDWSIPNVLRVLIGEADARGCRLRRSRSSRRTSMILTRRPTTTSWRSCSPPARSTSSSRPSR